MNKYTDLNQSKKLAEVWKDAPGFEGYYEVSTESRVRSIDRKIVDSLGRTQTIKGKTLLQSVRQGYWKVGLSKGGKVKGLFVHRIVALAFIPNPDKKPFINHKNGIKTDNRIENLEWCTQLENIEHARRNDLWIAGTKNGKAKLNEMQVRIIRRMKGDMACWKIGEYFGVAAFSIRSILIGKSHRNTGKYIGEGQNG